MADCQHDYQLADYNDGTIGQPNTATLRCNDCGHERTVRTLKSRTEIEAEAQHLGRHIHTKTAGQEGMG